MATSEIITLDSYRFDHDGFLLCKGVFGRVGVMDYYEPEYDIKGGKFTPPEVLEAAKPTLLHRSITLNHPENQTLVSPNNYKKYEVGHVTNVVFDGHLLIGEVIIKDKEAIDKATSTHQELSLGYKQLIVPQQGVYFDDSGLDVKEQGNGRKYSHVATKIVFNHLALCEKGRAGSMVRLYFDSVSFDEDHYTSSNKTYKVTNMKNLIYQNRVISVPDEIYEDIERIANDAVSLAQDNEKLKETNATLAQKQGAFDAVNDSFNSLKSENADLKKKLEAALNDTAVDSEAVNKELEERLAVWKVIGFDSKTIPFDVKKSAVDLKREYLKALKPDKADTFTSYSADSVNSYWDVALDMMPEMDMMSNKMSMDMNMMLGDVKDGTYSKQIKPPNDAFEKAYPSIDTLMGRNVVGGSPKTQAITPRTSVYTDSSNINFNATNNTATIKPKVLF